MIFTSVARAFAQLGDPRFRAVLFKGLGLTLALLAALYVAVFWIVQWILPATISIPYLGTFETVRSLASWGSVVLLIALSPFLMFPVASAFTGLFLDDIADAVEARHFADLPRAPRISLMAAISESLGFLGIMIVANALALIVYLLLAPLAPLIFYALNGFLLGREYFRMIAVRRLGRPGAIAANRRHWVAIWATGALMAIPLSVPIVNVLVPILGAAAFTHLYHSLEHQSGQL